MCDGLYPGSDREAATDVQRLQASAQDAPMLVDWQDDGARDDGEHLPWLWELCERHEWLGVVVVVLALAATMFDGFIV